jgi:hypothetical protein
MDGFMHMLLIGSSYREDQEPDSSILVCMQAEPHNYFMNELVKYYIGVSDNIDDWKEQSPSSEKLSANSD